MILSHFAGFDNCSKFSEAMTGSPALMRKTSITYYTLTNLPLDILQANDLAWRIIMSSEKNALLPQAKEEIQEQEIYVYDTPSLDLVFRSALVHRQHHNPSKIQRQRGAGQCKEI